MEYRGPEISTEADPESTDTDTDDNYWMVLLPETKEELTKLARRLNNTVKVTKSRTIAENILILIKEVLDTEDIYPLIQILDVDNTYNVDSLFELYNWYLEGEANQRNMLNMEVTQEAKLLEMLVENPIQPPQRLAEATQLALQLGAALDQDTFESILETYIDKHYPFSALAAAGA